MNDRSQRREVRVTETFFVMLDEQLGLARGPNGEPSATDFLVVDLPEIVEIFATRFDSLAMVTPEVPAARVYVNAGSMVSIVAVFGLELTDGSVELIGIEIDP